MRHAWTIAKNDLSLRARDRSIYIIGLVAPLALAFIFNAVFGGGISDVGETITFEVGIANVDQGPIGAAFEDVIDSIASDGLLEVTTFDSAQAARSAADDGTVGAAFILPEGLSDAVLGGADATIEVVGNVDAPTTTQVASSISEQFGIGVRTANLSVATAMASGALSPEEAFAAAGEAGTADPAIEVGSVEAASRQLDSAAYFVAGLSIFFLFFIAGMSITSMLEERREGTLSRLLAAPIKRQSIVAGKSLASILIGLASMTVLVIVSSLIMGADWGPPVGVAMLIVGAVLAVTALMIAVGSFAKTPEQAGNLQSIVAVTLGMLGGTFVPIAQEGFLAKLSLITPNAWFIRGLGDLTGGGISAALPAVFVLLAIALVAGSIGLIIAGRSLRL
ncbi:MAG: ABC transporter permease [Acidimicrobiia bacterium]|nr:ABC transporter permease [Acidimicrobiia bacterium]MDH5505176.1 ABC transporter permease [Acidimicrobiia bacterium]